MSIEFDRIRKTSTNSSYWITKTRDKEKIYKNECVTKLKGCGKESKKKVLLIGILKVGDLQAIVNINDVDRPPRLSLSLFQTIWNAAMEADTIDTPDPIDHRRSANPYLSKYGDEWEKHLKKSPTMSTNVVITDYIQHIMTESELVMKGTKYEGTWMIYHDTLSLMTAERTKQWMKDNNFFERWVLPTDDLYDNMPEIKRKYTNHPLGNSPEFMPWDAHLNQDVHSSLDFLV